MSNLTEFRHTIYTSPLKPLSTKGFNYFEIFNEVGFSQ